MRGEHGAIEDPARRGKRPGRGGWRCRAALVVGLAVLGPGATPTVAAADRVALVIGNSAYEHTSELSNPVNDAAAMRDALTRLGFDVVFRRDADEDAMDDALGEFEEMSAGAELALVFYAGHGLEMNGSNYLVPVDARLSSAAAVGRETVALDDVLNAVAEARTRIVILDACRNNPFTRSMRGAVRANVRSGGLAAVAVGAGSLVAYAAAAGDVADDGEGRHSPFTEALLAQIEQPGVEVRIMLGNVGEAVRARTRRQQPFVYSSLSGEHYLKAVVIGATVATAAAVEGATATARLEQENLFWESVRESRNPADFEAYLRQFPSGAYRALATNRLAALRADRPAPAAANNPPPLTPVPDSVAEVVPERGDPPSMPPKPSPIVESARDPELELSALLRRRVSVARSDENGWTDLHYAAVLNLPGAVERLALDGAKMDAQLKMDGGPLGAQLNSSLQRLGRDLSDWTRDGETPLHVAAYVAAEKAAATLLAYGADPNAITEFGWTPLHYAAWSNAVGVVNLLLDSGVNIHATTLERDDVHGARYERTALQVALANGSRQAASVLRAGGAR